LHARQELLRIGPGYRSVLLERPLDLIISSWENRSKFQPTNKKKKIIKKNTFHGWVSLVHLSSYILQSRSKVY
jgi:hypothetical protein